MKLKKMLKKVIPIATGYIIALTILVIAVVGLIIGIVVAMKNISETVDYINDFSDKANHVVEHYQPDIEKMNDQVQLLSAKAEGVSETFNYKMTSVELLQEEGADLIHHIQLLNDNKEIISQHVLEQAKDVAQTEIPKKWDNFKEVTKRTVQKQKDRYKNS